MLDNVNIFEFGALILLALFIFGPERLPKVIGDGLRIIRRIREMARNATSDLSRELGTEVSVEDLHPKTFLRKHLLSEEEERQLRQPIEQAYLDVKQIATDTNGYLGRPSIASPPQQPAGAHEFPVADERGVPALPPPAGTHPPFPGSHTPTSGALPQSGPAVGGSAVGGPALGGLPPIQRPYGDNGFHTAGAAGFRPVDGDSPGGRRPDGEPRAFDADAT